MTAALMTGDTLFAYSAAVLCGGLAIAVFLFPGRQSLVRWSFGLGMVALAAEMLCLAWSARALLPAEILYWERLCLLPAALLPGSWLLFSASFARAEAAVLATRRRWLFLGALVLPLALVTVSGDSFFLQPAALVDETVLTMLPLGWPGYLFFLVFLCLSILILVNLEQTFRASRGEKRWRIKFMVLGVGSLFAVRIYTLSNTLLFFAVDRTLGSVHGYTVVVADALIILSLLRNRLFQVDVHLSPTALYNSLAVLIVGIYLLTVGVLAKTIEYFGGSEVLSLSTFFVFVALLLLAIVLLSDHLQHQVKRFLGRHIYHSRYDYRKEWTTFTQRTSLLLKTPDLCRAVCRMVSDTFAVSAVTMWLSHETPEQFSVGGSTALSSTQTSEMQAAATILAEVMPVLRSEHEDTRSVQVWDLHVQELTPHQEETFRALRIRYCIPLVAGQQWLGVMTCNEPYTRESFSIEDEELLKTIADQAARSLLNLTLSQRLVQAKELEAFQSLSAFFLHDLKNLASMLSLTMQNLPAHYDDPAFRQDALQTISRCVAKINSICSRLSLFTRHLDLQRTEVDLNEMVKTTLADLNGSLRTALTQHLHPLPRVSVDVEQINKVLTNLVLNANDAVSRDGEIHVTTERVNGWAVVSVRDNGCGISAEFRTRSLFHPFRTTKSQGLGIGLFQSKLIVEAHQGKIEVDSTEGQGSTFRVFLPVQS